MAKTREEQRKYDREYKRAQRAVNPQPHRDQSSKWAKAHPEERRAYMRRYYHANKAKWQQRYHRTGASGTIAAEDWESLKRDYNDRCAACLEEVVLTRDHVVPLSKGGPNVIENLQPLCRSCNSKKHTKTVLFIEGQPVLFDYLDHGFELIALTEDASGNTKVVSSEFIEVEEACSGR